MTGYGPLDILWLDAGQVRPPKQDIKMAELAAMARRHQPGRLFYAPAIPRLAGWAALQTHALHDHSGEHLEAGVVPERLEVGLVVDKVEEVAVEFERFG